MLNITFFSVYSMSYKRNIFFSSFKNLNCYKWENALLVNLSWHDSSALVFEDANHRIRENVWTIGHKT